MKIAEMRITDYKNIDIVDVELDEHVNVISGPNGAGKSSVVGAMIDALMGKTEMGKNPQRKIKKGKDSAEIEVVLHDDDGDLVVKRKITQKDVYLKASRSDGTPVKQTDLSKLLDNSTINITKLLFMGPKEQIDFVKEIAGIDTEEVEAKYKSLYAERTILNRTLKSKQAAVDEAGDVEKVEKVDVSSLQNELTDAINHNSAVDKSYAEFEEIKRGISFHQAKVEESKNQIEQLKKKIRELELAIEDDTRTIASLEEKKVNHVSAEYISIDGINKKIAEASKINRMADEYAKYVAMVHERDRVAADVERVNIEMENALKEREEIIKSGKLPFKNIGFDKELGLTIGGIPFSEMSTAQQIRVMSRIYIESNPTLKVIYIQDGSLLDDDTLKQITEMSDMKDFQFLIEVVGDSDGADIVMREGHVVGGQDEDK